MNEELKSRKLASDGEARPLNAGADVPENATYIDAIVNVDMANPVKIDKCSCSF